MPLQVWKIFSTGCQNEGGIPLNLLRYREDIKTPRFPLQFYTTALTSPNGEFLTALSLTTIFTVPDLVRLSSITNLAVLEIVHTAGPDVDSGVSDRLLRTWHEASITKAAFRVLRILRLWNHNKVTSKSLSYISSFPALALYDVRDCSLGIEAKALAKSAGWTTSFDVGSVAIFEAACVDRAIRLGASDGIVLDTIHNAASQQLNDDSIVTRIPRREIRQFLTNASRLGRRSGMPQSLHGQKADDAVVKPGSSQAESREDSNRSHRRKSKAVKPSWEFDLYTIFSKIGELRNDQDLVKGAGLNVGDQAIVNDELVNSVPIACLRLGPSPAYLLPANSSERESFYQSMFSEPIRLQVYSLPTG